MWNPIMYAIYFRQVKTLQYFVDEVKVNIRIACDRPETSNEYQEEKQIVKDLIGE
jgi:hypothetical protein